MISTKQNKVKSKIDDKKYIGGCFYDWALADKDNPLPLYYRIKHDGKIKAEFFDNIMISAHFMVVIRRAILESVEYETDHIKVTLVLDNADYDSCFLELDSLRHGYDINKNRVKKLQKK